MQNINGMAYLKRAEYGKVDLDYVLGVGGFDLERSCPSLIFFPLSKRYYCSWIAEHHSHSHAHDHTHDPGVSSVSIVCEGNLDLNKGSPDRLWGPEEPRVNKIVFIGKNLNAEELEKGFKSCLV
ncbi:hypothetical protein BHE74_00022882 [Ensete ventricosum]|uniref:Uncharacterized protein n=1 Tax=Ensete ventricosum TaxID=4639 RepID=A0A426Y7K8_ENSVE|nr:hypothetical protein B296_00045060 [Ensete ventricosum]RWV94068.1 hypothetical protein GW17_00043430 [Ensete ventricosum]RWW69513.1 hypothetical protein BHE74_00022882 [Ensete ventricosum]RZR84308.1 hypothetical protein BHM03_00011097 [Ensete ventricosum]